MKLDVNTQTLNCHSTSGSDIKITGTTDVLVASATSGSDIDARNLSSEKSNV